MSNLVVKAIVLLALPVVVLLSGGSIMAKLSGRDYVMKQFSAESKDKNGLGLRVFGYDLEAVRRRWAALDKDALKCEQRGLELDLLFPFFYGAGLAGALLLGWVALGRPFQPAWLLLPVAITMVADWIENLVQLGQLRLFNASHEAGLQSGWIQIASAATIVKLLFYGIASLLVIYLAGWMIVRAIRT